MAEKELFTIKNVNTVLLVFLLAFRQLFFLHGFCRLFLVGLFTILAFAHGMPLNNVLHVL